MSIIKRFIYLLALVGAFFAVNSSFTSNAKSKKTKAKKITVNCQAGPDENYQEVVLKGKQKLVINLDNLDKSVSSDSIKWVIRKNNRLFAKKKVSKDRKTLTINASHFRGKKGKEKACLMVYGTKGAEIICSYIVTFK